MPATSEKITLSTVTLPSADTFTASVWVKRSTNSPKIKLSFAGTESYEHDIVGWKKLTVTANTSGSQPVELVPTSDGFEQIFADGLIVSQGVYLGDFFDGSTTDSETTQYAWSGAANKSSSTATTTAKTYALELAEGTVNVKSGNVRRTFNGEFSHDELTSFELYDLLSNEASTLKVKVGFQYGDTSETIDVFRGRIAKSALGGAETSVKIAATDFGFDLNQQSLIPAVTQPAGMTRRDAIKALVSAGFPGVTIDDTATDSGTLISEQTWSGSRWEAINTLATDGNMECFFGPNGTFIIRDIPTIGEPVYLLKTSDGGTITAYSRERPLDQLFNAVIVQPKNTDGSQTWAQQYVEITDTSSPRHKSKIGVRAQKVDNVTGTAAEALAVANKRLSQLLGKTETVELVAIANPALEVGDTVQIIAKPWLDTGEVVLTHIVDGFSFNIRNWSMSVSTRNLGE